jgi:hypothetical protein
MGTYARMGKMAEARSVPQDFLERVARRYVSPESVAIVYTQPGRERPGFRVAGEGL